MQWGIYTYSKIWDSIKHACYLYIYVYVERAVCALIWVVFKIIRQILVLACG